MKNKIFKIISAALICTLSLTGGITAFAETEKSETIITSNMENKDVLMFAKYHGKVTSYVKDKSEEGSISITLSDSFGDVLVLNTTESIKVYDAENKSFISLEDVKEGDNLFVITDASTPMTMSLPPMINSASYIIKTNDMMNVAVGCFDNELISSKDDLLLNISPETFITDIMGSRKIFTAEDIKGAQCAVVYSFATMSIPAQTTPEAVIILKSANIAEESYNMPLRSTFESMGYEVKWISNNEPIIVTNSNTTISVTIGSNEVIINGVKYVLNNNTVLKNDIACVDSSILKYI